jgi:FKBP-type peptidyl-prolyl cis-trans isomerase
MPRFQATWLLAALLVIAGCKSKSTSSTGSSSAPVSGGTSAAPAAPAAGGAATSTTPKSEEVVMQNGLKYQDLKVGDGTLAEKGMSATVHYTGWLTDGTEFDSSLKSGRPFTFRIGAGEVIQGWDEGVAGMRVGGQRKLTIPPALGYGAAGAGGVIPPNATLVFEVQLLNVR